MIKKIARNGYRLARKTCLRLRMPFSGRISSMTEAQAREYLTSCWPKTHADVSCKNCILDPVCDLQIIIPAYNVEKYLDECMQSVLGQKTKYSFKVVLVDDGSTDRTGEMVDRYASDPRVQVIHQQNRGLSGARNRALEEIFGRYILFVDSDDLLCDGAIEALMDAAYKYDSDMVEGSVDFFSDAGREAFVKHNATRVYETPLGVFKGIACSKALRAQLFENIRFPEKYWFEDSIMSFCIYQNVKNAVGIADTVYLYRRNQSGICASANGNPRAVETYWVSELLMEEHAKRGLPCDERFLEKLLSQVKLNHTRVLALDAKAQESMFVLSCALMKQYFPEKIIASHPSPLVKILKNKDFGRFCLYCKL